MPYNGGGLDARLIRWERLSKSRKRGSPQTAQTDGRGVFPNPLLDAGEGDVL